MKKQEEPFEEDIVATLHKAYNHLLEKASDTLPSIQPQAVSKEMFEALTEAFPCSVVNEVPEENYPVYVIAGNAQQARYYITKLKMNPSKTFIVTSIRQLRGTRPGTRVIFYGTYRDRKDFQDLMEICEMRQLTVEYVEEV